MIIYLLSTCSIHIQRSTHEQLSFNVSLDPTLLMEYSLKSLTHWHFYWYEFVDFFVSENSPDILTTYHKNYYFDIITACTTRQLTIILSTACSSGEVLTESSGSFSSPNFPNYFPNYIRCTWNITVPSGYIIKLSFHNFTLGYPSRNGSRLTITNVWSDDGYHVFHLFRDNPPPVYSLRNSSQLIFISLSGQYSGFNASYTAIIYDSGKFTYGVCWSLL